MTVVFNVFDEDVGAEEYLHGRLDGRSTKGRCPRLQATNKPMPTAMRTASKTKPITRPTQRLSHDEPDVDVSTKYTSTIDYIYNSHDFRGLM